MRVSTKAHQAQSILDKCDTAPLEAVIPKLISYPSLSRATTLLLRGISHNLEAEREFTELSKEEFIDLSNESFSDTSALRMGDVTFLPKQGHATLLSDLEGDLRTLYVTLLNTGALERLSDPDCSEHLCILGDFIDRSTTSLAFLEFVLILQNRFPNRVHILAGNHELSPGVQHKPLGFFREIEECDFELKDSDWRYLRWCQWFNDYIRGVTGPFDDALWIYSSEQRVKPRDSLLLHTKERRARETPTLHDRETISRDADDGIECSSSESMTLRNRYRERISKLYLWELAQTYFLSLPKLVVGQHFVATHGLPPVKGEFSPEHLSTSPRSSDDFLFSIARLCDLPQLERRNVYNEMVWSDIHPPDSPEELPPLAVVENKMRGDGNIVTAEAVQLLLKALGRNHLFRGHQHFSNPENHQLGNETDGLITTINSSRRYPHCTAASVDFDQQGLQSKIIDLHSLFKKG